MTIFERYGRLGEEDDFDRDFWAKQPPEAVFDAAYDMIKDYLLLKEGLTGEPRLERTIERYRRSSCDVSDQR